MTSAALSAEQMLEREKIANRKKHWVRAVTACNSKCLFCLDADTPRNVYLPEEEVKAELRRGREELDADKVIISGGEATLHPKFFEFVRYAKEIGYDRVQTVTNGTRFSSRDYYKKAMKAGLGEITFSLHGHTPELHDYLTQTPNAFVQLMKGMIRAIRDPHGPIVNVDIVINKQNVGVLDKIIETAASVGVREFDLLHVIPQSNAYTNREEMFYDVADHIDILHKVFKLNRHPGFVIWTNRFPVDYLEGLEDLIQDPHKMLDEVNGRRFMVRNYLDTGRTLDCREPERCQHCFIEPFCTTMDRTMQAQNEQRVELWDVGEWTSAARSSLPTPLPFGISRVAAVVDRLEDAVAHPPPAGAGWELRAKTPGPVPAGLARPLRLVADDPAQLEAWADTLPDDAELVIELNVRTAPWIRENAAKLGMMDERVRIHQPSWEHMKDALENDVRDPAAFFRALGLRVRTSGLPACGAPGTLLEDAPLRHRPTHFDWKTGRVAIRPLAKEHVATFYRSKSLRCRQCPVTERCEGVHINMIRDQGLKTCQPLTGDWAADAQAQLTARWPTPPTRVHTGQPTQPAPDSLPGYAKPTEAVVDPLAEVAIKLKTRAKERAKARAAGQPLPPKPYTPRSA